MSPGRRVLALDRRVRLRLALVVAVLMAITATYVAQAVLIAIVIGRIFAGDSLASTVPFLAVAVVLVGVRAGLVSQQDVLAARASGAAKAALRQRVVEALFRLGPGWLQRTRTGTAQSTVVDGVESVDPYVGQFLPQAIAAVAGAAGIAAFIIGLDPLVGGIVLACAAVTPLVPVISDRVMRPLVDRWWVTYRGLYADNLDALQGMTTLKSFNASRRRGAHLGRNADEFCRDSIRVLAYWGAYLGVVGLATAGGTAVAVGIGAVQRAEGALTTTQLLLILLLTRECFRPLRDLESAYHSSWTFRSTAGEIFELIDAEPDVIEPAHPEQRPTDAAPSLSFRDVTFSYPGQPRPALHGFSLDVAPGERVALVGRSGSGKTTAVSLLLRLFDPQRGRIEIAGRDIRRFTLADLRSLVAVVSQDTYLFHGTVSDNLRLARPDATDAELVEAAQAARAHDFISALPQGYDTVVGERGLRLSGGERQRVAIARALLKDAPILVLDEATSAVDGDNEAAITQALSAVAAGRTTLVIAHRLSTVRDADRLVVLDAGRVAEVGDHAGLVGRRGAYARLVAAQAVAQEVGT